MRIGSVAAVLVSQRLIWSQTVAKSDNVSSKFLCNSFLRLIKMFVEVLEKKRDIKYMGRVSLEWTLLGVGLIKGVGINIARKVKNQGSCWRVVAYVGSEPQDSVKCIFIRNLRTTRDSVAVQDDLRSFGVLL